MMPWNFGGPTMDEQIIQQELRGGAPGVFGWAAGGVAAGDGGDCPGAGAELWAGAAVRVSGAGLGGDAAGAAVGRAVWSLTRRTRVRHASRHGVWRRGYRCRGMCGGC